MLWKEEMAILHHLQYLLTHQIGPSVAHGEGGSNATIDGRSSSAKPSPSRGNQMIEEHSNCL